MALGPRRSGTSSRGVIVCSVTRGCVSRCGRGEGLGRWQRNHPAQGAILALLPTSSGISTVEPP